MHLIVVIRYIDYHWVTVLVELALNGQAVEVLCLVVGNLLSIHRETLCEVSETIEETDSAHINIRVRSLLYIVTSKHTQTTTVNLQGRVDTILHAEVSY